ncbi:MAG: DUF1460 domain-containing protein [bacterium]|nr:DUF1460 domain-containing protein [bacterium]
MNTIVKQFALTFLLLLIYIQPNFSFAKNINDLTNLTNPIDDYEKMKCSKKLKSFDASLKELPINELIAEVGKTFIGTPYVAGTLDENPNSEELVINITGLDCVTFVENALIFSRLIKSGKTDIEDYKAELEKIRYRDGQNSGYPSRLHYFSDWIYDNEQKGIVKDITKDIGGVLYGKTINFMSGHRNSYKQLADDNNYSLIGDTENKINTRDIYYIPVEDIPGVYDKLQTGDIVGITSRIDGLDVAHTGYVYKENGKTYLLNASLKDKQVEISPMELQDYILGNKKQGGIIVARVLDVK